MRNLLARSGLVGALVTVCGGATALAASPSSFAATALTPSPRQPSLLTDPDLARTPPRFTVIGMPDTQNYSEFYPSIYSAQTTWIAKQKNDLNIQFVSHYGDVVNDGGDTTQWANARASMDILDQSGIPYGVTAGNHDITPSGTAGTPYIPQQYLANFGAQNYAGKDWYLGASPSGMSNAQIFSGGGREFIALHILCDAPVEELAWAQGIMNNHRDKPVMMTTHRYLQDAEDYTGGVPVVPSGYYPDIWYGVEGTYAPGGIRSGEIFDWFVRRNKQIFLVNCGHFHEEFRQTSTNAFGNPVHEVLADYQDDPNGGDGWLRLMEFDVGAGQINFDSYSPTRNEFRTADESKFSLGVNFQNYTYADRSVSFQNGVNGYNGTQDTWINQASANTSYGPNQTFDVDDDTTNSIFSDSRGQGLVRFDNMFSANGTGGTVPLGATITSATLRLQISDDVDFLFDADFRVYMLTRPWDESSTWNSLGNGLQEGADYATLLGELEGDNNPDADGMRILNVTLAVQLWANGLANYGFAIVPEVISGNDDGITIISSENANILLRPVLDVSFVWDPSLARAVPSTGTAGLLALAGLHGARRRRRA